MWGMLTRLERLAAVEENALAREVLLVLVSTSIYYWLMIRNDCTTVV